jgi:hypothetical protein
MNVQEAIVLVICPFLPLRGNVAAHELVGHLPERPRASRGAPLFNRVCTRLDGPQQFLRLGARFVRGQSAMIADRDPTGPTVLPELSDVHLGSAGEGTDAEPCEVIIPEDVAILAAGHVRASIARLEIRPCAIFCSGKRGKHSVSRNRVTPET